MMPLYSFVTDTYERLQATQDGSYKCVALKRCKQYRGSQELRIWPEALLSPLTTDAVLCYICNAIAPHICCCVTELASIPVS